MSDTESLTGQFLIAMPAMTDPNFEQTVSFICQHNEDGAMGIVINRTMDLTLGDVFQQMEIEADGCKQAGQSVHYGGPVQTERGFVLHDQPGDWDSTVAIDERIGLTTSRDILEAIGRNAGPTRALLALGYAGWGSGQLEHEITQNAWLSGPADIDLMFSTPVEQRWNRAAGLLGIDLSLLSREAGHA
ncbi:MAG TPA: YqgE/AlgH family protein [Arenicellales bacterium]|nr:YqgE/AlgH family protein [Arenicellales bacterium]